MTRTRLSVHPASAIGAPALFPLTKGLLWRNRVRTCSNTGDIGLILLGATGTLLVIGVIASIAAASAKRRTASIDGDVADEVRAFRPR